MRTINGLSQLAEEYDGFIIDLWGVIHDGVRPYQGAVDCLRRLQSRPVLLLSNAPRRAYAARQMLRTMGIEDALYTDILTSGEAVWMALRDRSDSWFAKLGRRAFLLGPERDRSVLLDLDLEIVGTPAGASFVVNTGPDDLGDPSELAPFVPVLDECLRAGLPMICANPDLVVIRGGSRILCAGALAEYYVQAGGDVRSVGKPLPDIYDMALDLLAVDRNRVLAIGDSLRTDIAGAAEAGLDAVWVLGGIHADELDGDAKLIAAAAAEAGLQPTAVMRSFIWA